MASPSPATAHKLADETLKDILAYVLDVPDEDFASCSHASPFALRQFSTADFLLVCKRWFKQQSLAELWDCDLHALRATACEVISKHIIETEPASSRFGKKPGETWVFASSSEGDLR